MRAKKIALGGVMAALAAVIMCMGGLIPFATFVCPLVCCLILQFISASLGTRMSWAWYTAVSVISLLIGPDKEAAAVFLFLGYYPIIRPLFPSGIWGWDMKAFYFNASVGVMYFLLIYILGIDQVAAEYAGVGAAMAAVLIVLGNLTFLLLDRLLSMIQRRFL